MTQINLLLMVIVLWFLGYFLTCINKEIMDTAPNVIYVLMFFLWPLVAIYVFACKCVDWLLS